MRLSCRYVVALAGLAATSAVGNTGTAALADSDNFYTFNYEENQAYEENSQRYQTSDGNITNFTSEIFPLVPDTDGQVFLRGETVTSPGTGQRLEDGRTAVQIEFKF